VNIIERIRDKIGVELDAVEEEIKRNTISWVSEIPKVSQYLINSGGKRIRPIFLILLYRGVCGEGDDYIIPSVVAELLHTATLLHDDVIDGASTRRGKPSANIVYGNLVSVLVGDFLFATAFHNILKINNPSLQAELVKTAKTMSEGEVFQAVKRRDINITIEEYEKIVFAKTAALFEWCAYAVSSNANIHSHQLMELKEFGKIFGIVFQMKDDILDYTGNYEKTKKDLLNDLKEGHITLPLIIAMERDRELREYIKSVVGKETIDFDKEYIVSSVKRHIDITYEYLDRWHKRGIEIIERFSDNIYTNLLYELFKFIREREY